MDDLKIGGMIDHYSTTLGLDSREHCFSKTVFDQFPYSISYQFNSLGYRERQPLNFIKDPIIVVGDSFTLGLGLPQDLIYPAQLETLVNHQVLNFSLNGASNDWISRKLQTILKYFSPKAIIVHYSFSHRRELNNPSWFDDERTLCEASHEDKDNLINWQLNHKKIQSITYRIPTVYSFIPQWHSTTMPAIENQISIQSIDFARDNFHYGINTSRLYAERYADYINQL